MHKLGGFGVALALAATTGLTWSTPPGRAQTSVQTQTVVSDVEIAWAAQFAGDGRLFLTERPGRIRIIRNDKLDPQPWATIPVAHVGEGGLLGLALAPDFTRSKFVYVYYTYQADGRLWHRSTRLIDQNARPEVDRGIFDQI